MNAIWTPDEIDHMRDQLDRISDRLWVSCGTFWLSLAGAGGMIALFYAVLVFYVAAGGGK